MPAPQDVRANASAFEWITYSHRHGNGPAGCDFVFVSADLQQNLRSLSVGGTTLALDHQPVLLELAG